MLLPWDLNPPLFFCWAKNKDNMMRKKEGVNKLARERVESGVGGAVGETVF